MYGNFGKEKNIEDFLRRKGWGDKGMRWLEGGERDGGEGKTKLMVVFFDAEMVGGWKILCIFVT